MFEQFMWQKFLTSGSICDYLVLKEETLFSAEESSAPMPPNIRT